MISNCACLQYFFYIRFWLLFVLRIIKIMRHLRYGIYLAFILMLFGFMGAIIGAGDVTTTYHNNFAFK
jgi:hypothetical protein